MKSDYESINNLLGSIHKSSPDIYKYYILFSNEDLECILRHDDYGHFYIPKSINEFLNRFAQKNELDIKELILFFRMGYLEGKIHFQEQMNYELEKYQFDGVKNYLLNKITKGNQRIPTFGNSEDGIPKKFHTNFIKEFGYNSGEYYEAWRALVERHWLFNDFFKEINIKEYKRNVNNPYSQMFPKRYFQYSNVPDSVQCASDLKGNCYTLIDVLKNKIIPFKNEEGIIQNLHFIIKPNNTSQFYHLCSDFLKEAANNHEKGLVEINKEYYKSIIHKAEECIEILQDPMFQNCDMSSFDGFENTNRNWFITISDCLISYVDSFKKTYDFLYNLKSIESQTESEVLIKKVGTINSRVEIIKDDSRKNKDFVVDYLIGNEADKVHLLNLLNKDLLGKKGKEIAIIIIALEETKLISYSENKELFSVLKKDLKIEGTISAFNKYLTPTMRDNKFHLFKVSLYVEKIKKHMEIISPVVV